MTQTIAIVGANLCGWMTAAALARRLPYAAYQIMVIDDGAAGDGLGDFAPMITVPPALVAFHAEIGLDHAALVGAGGGHALGVAFDGWRGDGSAAFLSYGETGAPYEAIAFHHLVGRLRATGANVRLADHALAAVAAQTGRFAPDGSIAHAVHVRTDRYSALLRSLASNAGATMTSAPLADVHSDADGIVERLTLADGSEIAPLLVLDCSGSAGVVAGRTSPAFEDWSALLPCDRTQVALLPAKGAPPPYTQVDAQDDGWIATWPVEGVDVRLICRVGGEGHPFRAGRRVEAWRGNCVALGAAAGVLEPLHPTALSLLLRSLARLIQLWPATPRAPVEAAAFNRAGVAAIEGARDFLVAQYAVAGRAGGFWDDRRSASLPEHVAAKRDLFAARGRLPMYDDEPFEEEDWAAMFDAMGVVPRRYDARADLVPVDAIERHLAENRARIIARLRALPSYAGVAA
jgi:tryptophan halogenase